MLKKTVSVLNSLNICALFKTWLILSMYDRGYYLIPEKQRLNTTQKTKD
jgi:hypothetical protein